MQKHKRKSNISYNISPQRKTLQILISSFSLDEWVGKKQGGRENSKKRGKEGKDMSDGL